MSVRRHGEGWEIRFTFRGRPFTRTVRTSKAEAASYERKLRSELERGEVGLPARHTIGEAVKRWLAGEASALRSLSNIKEKCRQLVPWSMRPLDQIADVADEAKTQWLAAHLAPATINRRLAVLRRVANLAHNEWSPPWLSQPLGAKIKALSGERVRYVKATPEQAEALLAACGDKRVRDAITLSVLTGLRRSELLGLTQRHLEGARIVLGAATKTGLPRVVPLGADAQRIAQRLPLGLSKQDVRREFEAARKAAGMPWLQWRDLRRTFGSWVVQRTGSLKAAQDLLGHTTSQITSKHYAHLLESNLREAIDALPRVGQGLGRAKRKKRA